MDAAMSADFRRRSSDAMSNRPCEMRSGQITKLSHQLVQHFEVLDFKRGWAGLGLADPSWREPHDRTIDRRRASADLDPGIAVERVCGRIQFLSGRTRRGDKAAWNNRADACCRDHKTRLGDP